MTKDHPPSLILASASEIRRSILTNAGLEFDVCPTDTDEEKIKRAFLRQNQDIAQLAETLALAKARCITPKPNQIVIGADQILEMDGQVYDKPKTMAEAKEKLLSMRGRTHRLIGAVVLLSPGAQAWSHISTTELKMWNFSDAFLDTYLQAEGEAVLHTVGAYKFEGRGAGLFEWVKGDFFAVLGLPLLPLLAQLRAMKALAS